MHILDLSLVHFTAGIVLLFDWTFNMYEAFIVSKEDLFYINSSVKLNFEPPTSGNLAGLPVEATKAAAILGIENLIMS